MGIFLGHFMVGVFFLIFALWWSFMVPLRYIRNRNRNLTQTGNKTKFKGMPTYQCFCCPANLQKYPIESSIKLFFLVLGILSEIIMGLQKEDLVSMPGMEMQHHDHKREDMNNSTSTSFHFSGKHAQHLTMYSAFAFGALVEVLVHYKVHLPHRIDHVCGIISLTIEGLLFQFHLHDRNGIDTHVHILLVIAIYASVVSGILEYINPYNVLFAYSRILFMMLQGTWFCHIGFIVFPIFKTSENQWDPNNHMHIMTLTVTFIWHFLLIFIGLMVQFLILNRIYGINDKYSVIHEDEAEEIKYEKVMLVDDEATNNDDDEVI